MDSIYTESLLIDDENEIDKFWCNVLQVNNIWDTLNLV
jgi:hypothetical protein